MFELHSLSMIRITCRTKTEVLHIPLRRTNGFVRTVSPAVLSDGRAGIPAARGYSAGIAMMPNRYSPKARPFANINQVPCYNFTGGGVSSKQTRLFSLDRGGDGFGNRIKSIAKSMLPKSWFLSEEEKKAEMKRNRVKNQVSAGLDQIFKGAPLPVRVLGSMMKPLVSKLMSSAAESMAEQQGIIRTLIKDAEKYMVSDDTVIQTLGEPIQTGNPFAQSAASVNTNGKIMSEVGLSFPVSGSRNSGVAQLRAKDGAIQQLEVQIAAGGRVIAVNLSSQKKTKRKSFPSSSRRDDETIIEAEIIEKDTKK